jgi:hypothetical protein
VNFVVSLQAEISWDSVFEEKQFMVEVVFFIQV